MSDPRLLRWALKAAAILLVAAAHFRLLVATNELPAIFILPVMVLAVGVTIWVIGKIVRFNFTSKGSK